MDYTAFLKFLMNNFLFSFTIIIISFIFGYVLYNYVVLRKINLRDALFEKDNLAAWVEFIGAFIFPTLYLSATAIEGSLSDNIFIDLSICVAYLITYILMFTLLRMLSGVIVASLAHEDQDGKISLNNEIFKQKNIAASLFSIFLSIIFVSVIRFLDIMPDYAVVSLLKASDVLVFTLVSFLIYCLLLRTKTTLFKEIFIDNNVAAGVGLVGFIFAVETILSNAVLLQKEFDFLELAAFSLISLILLGILSVLFKIIFSKLIKVDIWSEVYEQNNIGAAIGQAALYIGIANVIVHFLK